MSELLKLYALADKDRCMNIGDVVKLKSGGPTMTIYRLSNEETIAYCNWFVEGKLQDEQFPIKSLTKYSKMIYSFGYF